jgi:glycopeptide antibiotics resistance protein
LARVTRGSNRAVYVCPLIRNVMGTGSGPLTGTVACCSSASAVGNDTRAVANPAAPTLAPLRKERREILKVVGVCGGGLSAGRFAFFRIRFPPCPSYAHSTCTTFPSASTIALRMTQQKTTGSLPRLGFALLSYMLGITLLITLLPFRFQWPQRWVLFWRLDVLDLVTNVLLFLPLGFLYQLAQNREGLSARLRTLGLGLGMSLAIEGLQLLERGRYSGVSDVLTNGLGAWVGVAVHDRIKRRLTERLANQLALELPLMNLFYLLTPLLWLNGLGAEDAPSRLLLAPILGFCGAYILTAVWIHRLRPAGVLSANAFALMTGAWFLLSSVPGLLRRPLLLIGAGLSIALLVRVLGSSPAYTSLSNRRFELPTLRRIWPLYLSYLCLLAIWPWPWTLQPWRATVGFAAFADDPGTSSVLRLLEHVAAFTGLGYLVAESRGRKEESLRRTLGWVLLGSLTGGGVVEFIQGFHPQHTASLARGIITIGAGVYGGAIYRLQLMAVRRLLARRTTQGL